MESLEIFTSFVSWSGWTTLGSIFKIIGILGSILGCIRLIYNCNRKRWSDNVSIREYSFDYDVETLEYNAWYSGTWESEPCEYVPVIVFKPLGCIIPTLKLIQLDDNGNEKKLIEVFKNITPQDSVCFRIELMECIPNYKLKWYSEYGEYSEYYFLYNMRSGNNCIEGTIYRKTLVSILRLIFDFK